jgi:hypothetical protein
MIIGGPVRAAILLTSVVAAGAGAAAHPWNRPWHTHRDRAREVVELSPAPQLTATKTPLRVPAGSGASTVVTVTGRGFEPSLTMTLTSPFYVFTFGPTSLDDVGADSFRFDAKPIPDGNYDLTVSNGAGRRSSAVTFVMQRK